MMRSYFTFFLPLHSALSDAGSGCGQDLRKGFFAFPSVGVYSKVLPPDTAEAGSVDT